MEHKELQLKVRIPWPTFRSDGFNFRRLLPTPGNVIFTLAMIALLVAAQTAGALPLGEHRGIAPTAASTGTIAYQGRLADAAGAPLTGTYNMIFRLYDAATGGTPLWSEQWTGSNGVRVSDGLFNVMLGSLTALPQTAIAGREQLFLGITVGTDDEMAPRVQLGSVPFAVQALTVPDTSVTTAKIANGAVTQAKLGSDVSLTPPDGSITTAKIADGAVTAAKQASRLRTVPMQLGSDQNNGVSTYNHLGYMTRFAVSHGGYARGAVKLPLDWVPGTSLRIAVGAQSQSTTENIAPYVFWATLNASEGNWHGDSATPNVTITTGMTNTTLKIIPADQVASGDIIAVAFRFPGNTQIIDVTGLYLEYTAQP